MTEKTPPRARGYLPLRAQAPRPLSSKVILPRARAMAGIFYTTDRTRRMLSPSRSFRQLRVRRPRSSPSRSKFDLVLAGQAVGDLFGLLLVCLLILVLLRPFM